MSDYGTSPFANPLPGSSDPHTSDTSDPFGAPASWDAPAAPPPPPSRSNALYELRPLSLGEILDRTFSLYRQRFWLYAGLSSIAAVASTLFTFVRLMMGVIATKGVPPAQLVRQGLTTMGVSLVEIMVYLIAYSLTQAATVSAISSVYLGEETTIGKSLKAVKGHWLRYIGIVLWQGFSAIWLPMVLFIPAAMMFAIPSLQIIGALLLIMVAGSLVYSVIAYIRNSLGIVAATVEDLTVTRAMRRSKVLVAGHKGRVFAIMLLMWVLSLAAGMVQLICQSLMTVSHGPMKVLLEAVLLLLVFLSTSVVAPVGAIGLCLFYIDERVRKEGFDVEILMLRGGAPPPPPPPEALASPFTSELV